MRRKGREKPDFPKYKKHNLLRGFPTLIYSPKQTLMSFVYYKRSKKEKLQFWRKILKVGAHKVIFAHPAKVWHTLQKFGTPCKSLAHPVKVWHTLPKFGRFWHTLPKFGTPCQILAHLANLMILPCEMLCFPPSYY